MLHLFFRKDIPPAYDLALKAPANAIKDPATFRTGWGVLILLLVGFFVLEPLGIPVSAIAAVGRSCLLWRNEAMPLTPAKCCAVRPGRS
jgi:arsenical pump membrane protein